MKVYTYPQPYQQIVDNFYFPDLCRGVYLYIGGGWTDPRSPYLGQNYSLYRQNTKTYN